MPRKKKSSTAPVPPLALFWKQEKERKSITYADITEKTDIPRSTLSRWFNGDVTDLKASQLAKVSLALGIPWWKSMARAQFTDEEPADPTEEAQRIASIIADEDDLQSIMGDVIQLAPRDRRAVRKYAEMLKQDDQNDPPASPKSE